MLMEGRLFELAQCEIMKAALRGGVWPFSGE